MFNSYPTYARYRTLRLVSPMMHGEDVYALQTALDALGEEPGVADGIFGRNTSKAVFDAQTKLGIKRDGFAGGQTQTALVKILADRARTIHQLPKGLVFGQLSHESGCRVGNYSPIRSNGTYDAGVAQRNTAFTPPKEGFTVPSSIALLGKNLRYYFNKYEGVESVRRKWELAAGAWNAPAYANWIARNEGATQVRLSETARPGSTARETLERYMKSATSFMEI